VFRIVKPVQLETSLGSIDAVIGEVKLQDGSRSRFYVMRDDIATSTPYDPNDYADPSPAVPLTKTGAARLDWFIDSGCGRLLHRHVSAIEVVADGVATVLRREAAN